jgi:hypothetical protein
MWRAGGETPTSPAGKRYALHHALPDGDILYAAWRDGGLTVIDVADPARSGSRHDAEHAMIERLAEALWEAQRAGRPPDEHTYLENIERLARG